jgi:hypothetical protein
MSKQLMDYFSNIRDRMLANEFQCVAFWVFYNVLPRPPENRGPCYYIAKMIENWLIGLSNRMECGALHDEKIKIHGCINKQTNRFINFVFFFFQNAKKQAFKRKIDFAGNQSVSKKTLFVPSKKVRLAPLFYSISFVCIWHHFFGVARCVLNDKAQPYVAPHSVGQFFKSPS